MESSQPACFPAATRLRAANTNKGSFACFVGFVKN
jgi:hypothetical protein